MMTDVRGGWQEYFCTDYKTVFIKFKWRQGIVIDMTGRATPVYENRISHNNPSILGTELVTFLKIKRKN
jgi:hypothetical protein